MKTTRVITIAIIIWILGVSCFVLGTYLPFLEDKDLQANITLLVAIFPIVWFASHFYYRKDKQTSGFIIGLVFFLISGILDALVTVPLLIIPQGASYSDFFTDPGFWAIGALFVLITAAYWRLKVKPLPLTQNAK